MTLDPAVVAALEAAVASDPDNTPLRLHLAQLLVDNGDVTAGLGHLEELLRRRPDDRVALELAVRAASGTGDVDRALAWQRLLDGLGGIPTVSPGPVAAAEGPEESSGDWDAALEDLIADPARGPRITLQDVGGLDDVKRRLNSSFLAPLRNPKLRKMYGATLKGGLLLWGPPGCGKTFVARAVAGELGARFIAVGLHDVLDMWLGNSERNVHATFDLARRNAPCVVFLDEIDALGHKRTNLVRSAGRNVVVQLLTELDGIADANDGVFVLGATNQPWDVDPALRRPGRFDRTLLVLPPDEPARRAILEREGQGLPVSPTIDVREIARRTEGFSGADLQLLWREASERALEDSIALPEPRAIVMDDLLAAAGGIRPTPGPGSTRPGTSSSSRTTAASTTSFSPTCAPDD